MFHRKVRKTNVQEKLCHVNKQLEIEGSQWFGEHEWLCQGKEEVNIK